MSHSSCITPVERKIDGSIKLLLLLIWGMIGIFWLITFMQPDWLKDISQMGRESEARDLKKMADHFLSENNLAAAEDSYLLAIKTDPGFMEAIGNLAITYAKMGNTIKAKKTINLLVERMPERAYVGYLNLGDIYRQQGDMNAALEYYHKALETDPFPGHALKMCGFCYKALGDNQRALEYYNKSLLVYGDFEKMYLGSIQRDHYNFRENETDANNLEALAQVIDLSRVIDHYDKTAFLMTINRDPEISKIYNEIGIIYFGRSKLELADKAFRNALAIDPLNRNARTNLKLVQQKLGIKKEN